MDLSPWHWWAIAALLLFILEIFTPAFLAASAGIGCLLAAACAGMGWGIELQLLAFSVGTAASMFSVRPFMKRYGGGAGIPTNVDALAGKIGRVSERIDHRANTGRVIVDGDDWRAVTENDQAVEAGSRVQVIRVDSTILLVRPIDQP